MRWLQPVHRRRRRRVPVGPILAVVLLLALAAGGYAFVRARDDAEDPSRAIAQRFADAWARGDIEGAWRLTTARTQADQPLAGFKQSYRQATRAATVTRVRVGRAGEPRDGRVPVPVVVAHPAVRGAARHDRVPGGAGRGDRARRLVARAAAARRCAPASACTGGPCASRGARPCSTRPGRRLSRTPAAAGLVDELEERYDERLGGRPGAELRYGRRVIAKVDVVPGRSVRTTIRPSLQSAATAALGGRLGGVAAIRPRSGEVLALAGLAVSAPQPPGSVFKIVTLAAALEAGETEPGESFPVQTAATLEGVRLRNAGDEACGGSLTQSFAHSCNSVFAPARRAARRTAARALRRGVRLQREAADPELQAQLDPARPRRRPRGRRERDRAGSRPRDRRW